MKKPVIGILMGDCGGVGPEVIAKTLHDYDGSWSALIIGPMKCLRPEMEKYAPECASAMKPYDGIAEGVQYIDVDAEDIPMGTYSASAGKAAIDAAYKVAELVNQGVIDGVLMGPHTNRSLHLADESLKDEIALLEKAFGVAHCGRIVKHSNVLRAAVVGPCPFRKIFGQITEEAILQTGEDLIEALKLFGLEKNGIAVSAMNPHKGDGGLFGDEEFWLDKVVEKYQAKHPDLRIEGTYAPDSLLIRGVKGQEAGLLYLHINQGEISMTTWAYGEETPIYVGLPCVVMSTEFGANMKQAGKGIADAVNMKYSLGQLLLALEH